MNSKIKQYLTEGRRLHRLLNSRVCPDDIDEQHQALFAHRKPLLDGTTQLLKTDGHDVHMHDSFISGFSEKRMAGGWRSTFHADAIAYGPDENGELEEKGYCRLVFEVEAKQPMRAMSGKEIYSFLIDDQTKELGASFHQPGRNMGVLVAEYTSISIDKGPVRSWEEVRRERLASTPSVDATLEVVCEDEIQKHPAKWYADGTILVLKEDEWTPYSDWCGRKYAQELPGVSQIFIDAGVEDVRSEIGAQSDDHGPGYASVQPLKSWMRRQGVEAGIRRRKP